MTVGWRNTAGEPVVPACSPCEPLCALQCGLLAVTAQLA